MKGQLSRPASERQEAVEIPLSTLGTILALLEHDSLRVHQAIERSGLDDLLGVVLEDHALIARNIRKVQARLRELWEAGQERRWD